MTAILDISIVEATAILWTPDVEATDRRPFLVVTVDLSDGTRHTVTRRGLVGRDAVAAGIVVCPRSATGGAVRIAVSLAKSSEAAREWAESREGGLDAVVVGIVDDRCRP